MRRRFRLLTVMLTVIAFGAIAPNALAAAKLRVLHGSPDVPAVTVYVNGQAAVPSLDPLTATDYLDLPAGTYKVAVALAGQPESAAVLRTDLAVEDGKRYTAFAGGLLADGSVKLGAQEDLWRAPFTRSALRVWHNSPDAPNVDVVVNGQTALSNVPFGAVSNYLPLPAGNYDVRILVAGTTTEVFNGQVALARGEAYTAIAQGSVAGTGEAFRVQVLKDATSGALLRVLHAAPDVPAVTVYVNGQPAVKRLGNLKATGYLPLDPGTYNVAVALAGQPLAKAVLRAEITLTDKNRFTALARGLLSKKTVELALQRDVAVGQSGKSLLRVWHLSPDAPRVDVYVNGKRAVRGLRYKRATAYLALDPGRYAVRITVANTQTTVWRGVLRVQANRAYSATALGAVKAPGAKFRVSALADV